MSNQYEELFEAEDMAMDSDGDDDDLFDEVYGDPYEEDDEADVAMADSPPAPAAASATTQSSSVAATATFATTSTTPSTVDAAATSNTGQMSGADSATEKRRAIQAIMRDGTLTELERRLRIQRLMDGSSSSEAQSAAAGRGGGIRSLVAGAGGLTSLLPGGGNTNGVAAGIGTSGQSGGTGEGDEEVVACVHYERKCNVVAPCCGGVFGCRVCHDEMSSACGPMDRFGIKEIVCKESNTRQSSA